MYYYVKVKAPGLGPYIILGTSSEHESPCTKDAPCQILMHSGWWFI